MKAVTWPQVLRVLPDDETRSYAVRRLRDAGFSADSFASKTKARETVAEVLTRIEDRLEGERGSTKATARSKIQKVRRSLENELWP
jgi:hypothetical protein